MSRIIDRRLNGKNKSAVNRQRFIRRYKKQIKKAVSDAVSNRSIKDIESSENISIPTKDIREPHFNHDRKGVWDAVHPGNREFKQGDKVERPEKQQTQGQGSKASDTGDGQDDFIFQLSKDEFLDLFFDDLELPNLTKKQLSAETNSHNWVRAGFMKDGVPTNINIIRSLRQAHARRIALKSPLKAQLYEKECLLEDKLKLHDDTDPVIIDLKAEIETLRKRIGKVPFVDPFDLRYNNRVKQPMPRSKAVMFCLMDVSGSMDQNRKDIAKRFFILLYLFLNRHYQSTDVVFIRHHTTAKEVNEEEFFYSQETGGTVVSSALKLMHHIIKDRYDPDEWNIYTAQASDGDNWGNDSPVCKEILTEKILPLVQYYAYVEITSSFHQSLWREYLTITKDFEHFSMQHIESIKDIYPVFRKLFKRQPA